MALASSAVNRVLADEPWARVRLAAHSGRTFSFRVGPLVTGFRIDGDGTLASASLVGATPDLVLTLSPFNVPAFLANPARWDELVTEEGDVELGGTLKELSRTLPWFVEKLCARAFGPIVGQRMADAGRRALELPEYASRRIGENVGAYARDEVEWLAHPADMRTLGADAQALDARVDALGARIDALAANVAALPARPADSQRGLSILLELATLELASAQRIDLPVLTFAVALELEEPLLPSSQGDNGTVIGGLRV